jgi:hypothetical protein
MSEPTEPTKPTWYVGKIGEGAPIAFRSLKEAEAAIVGIQLVDPEGVSRGDYYIDAGREE